MPCRDEMSKRINFAFAVTERKENRTLRKKSLLREQNALPYEAWIMKNLTAKDDVDNVGAGRAAKGENPVVSTKTAVSPNGCF